MAFKLKFLGTGGSFTRYDVNYHNNALVTTSAGTKILIDCGMTAPQALHEMGVKPWEIDRVIITHLHSDHIGGLEQLIWERYYTGPSGPGFLPTPVLCGPRLLDPIKTYLEQSLNPYTHRMGYIDDHWELELAQIDAGPIMSIAHNDQRTNIEFLDTAHVRGRNIDKPAYGFYLTVEGRQCYFSGDTTFDLSQIERAASLSDLIFHECMFFPKYAGTVHTHYGELLTLPKHVKEKIILMHHTQVPEGIDVVRDGFRAAAKRFEEFQIG